MALILWLREGFHTMALDMGFVDGFVSLIVSVLALSLLLEHVTTIGA
jgi:hypothetical protein